MERKRRYISIVLAVLLCLVTVLWGCQHSTSVILPPETLPTIASSAEGSSTALPDTPTTQPTTPPASAPATTPTTEPTSAPTMNPPTAPTSEPTTSPTTAPTTIPPTEPPTVPPTEPPTVPPTEPEPTQNGVYDISSHTIGSLEYSLLDALNGQRDAGQLPALTMDSTLCALAAIRAYECAENFSHTRPDGRSAYTVLSDYDYNIWSQTDEQLHCGSGDFSTSVIIRVWMNKDAFAASILSVNYTRIGIGIYTAGGYTYIACLFAG